MSRQPKPVVTRIHEPRGRGTINGRLLPGFDYRLIEYPDGTFEELGLPPGCPSRPDYQQFLFFSIFGTRFGRKVA